MSQYRLSFPDYLVVTGYFGIVLFIGFYFRRNLKAARDYFAGGHRVPWWLAGISHHMSSFSAFGFVAYAQVGYTHGWVAITLFWAAVPACLLGGLFFARRWRRARVITPVEFLERRYSLFIRQLLAWAGIPMKIMDDALKLFATALFLALSMGIGLHTSILACGMVMVAYAFLGGLWALVVTEYVQFIIKTIAILLLLPLAVFAAGGPGRAFSDLPDGFFRLSNGPYSWMYLFGFSILVVISYNGGWSLAQKYYSVKDEKEAARVAYCAAALNFIAGPIVLLPALIARNLMPDLLAQGRAVDTYVLLVLKVLPVGIIGIVVAAMFSATMAVVSSDFNALASVLTKDVYQRLINPGASERTLVRVGRWTTLGLGVVTTLTSLWIALTRQESLFSTMVTVLGIFMVPTLLPLLAGLTLRRLGRQGACAGFFAGIVTGFVMLAVRTWWLPTSSGRALFGSDINFEGITLLANIVATVLGMAAGTVWSHGRRDDEDRVRLFFEALDRPVSEDEIPVSGVGGANPIIGASTVGVGVLLAVAGILSGSRTALLLDVSIGALLFLVGVLFLRKRARTALQSRAGHGGE